MAYSVDMDKKRKPEPAPEFLTRHQVAELMDVTTRTVKRWMDSGQLQYERDERTGRVYIRADSPILKDAGKS